MTNVQLASKGTVSSNAVNMAKAINSNEMINVKKSLKEINVNASKEWDASKYAEPELFAGKRKQVLDKHLCCVVRNVNSKKVGLVHNVGYSTLESKSLYVAVIVLDPEGIKNTTWSPNAIEPIGMSASEYIELNLLDM